MIPYILMRINYTEFRHSVPDWILAPFQQYVGDLFYPIVFSGVIVLFYGSSKGGMLPMLAGILTVFCFFGAGKVFMNNPAFGSLMGIIGAFIVAGLFVKLVNPRTGGD